jgi:hypothetical protein
VQVPNRQNSFGLQAFPQAPQLALSRAVLVQPPGQHVLPLMSQHLPLQHSPVSNGPLHLRPQPPQLAGSDPLRSTHVLPHFFSPCGQSDRHLPPKQNVPSGQRRSHPPQLRSLSRTLTKRRLRAGPQHLHSPGGRSAIL